MRPTRRRFLQGVAAAAVAATVPGRTVGHAAAAAPDGGRRIRFGVISPQAATYDETLRFWQEAERLGFDTAFVNDHFMGAVPGPPASERCFEAWTLLSALAARTERIRLGVLVTGNTYRYPAVLAKMAVTVDHVSGGRLILGMGASWLEREHKALGIPFYTPGGRARRLVEAVEVVTELLTRERSTFGGKYYTLADAPSEPKAVQKPHPPILIGGMGAKVIQPLAARRAQIWHFMVPSADPAEVAKVCAAFDRLCRDAGRDPAEVEKATSLHPRVAAAPAKEQRAHVRVLADAGIRHVILLPPAPSDRGALARFAKDVMPAVR